MGHIGQCSCRPTYVCVIGYESYTVNFSVKCGSIDKSTDDVVLRLDCSNAQADMQLLCPHVASVAAEVLKRIIRLICTINLPFQYRDFEMSQYISEMNVGVN